MSSAQLREWSDWAQALADQIDDDTEIFDTLEEHSRDAFLYSLKLLFLSAENLRLCAELEELHECPQA